MNIINRKLHLKMKYLFSILCLFLSYSYCYETRETSQRYPRVTRTASESDLSNGNNQPNKAGVCVGTSCKKITSQMLAMMDHDQDYCEHFHKEICQESERITTNNIRLTKYFTQLKSYLYKISQSNSPTHSSFLNVYQSCLNYNMDFDFEKRMRFVTNYTETDLTKIFIDMVLTQSMPFFDIGLDIKKNGYKSFYNFQITLPGESSLDTIRRIWQTRDSIKVRCLQFMDSSTLDLDELNNNFKNCVNELWKSRIKKYVEDAKYLLKNDYFGVDAKTIIDFSQEIVQFWPDSIQIKQNKIDNHCQTVPVGSLANKYELIDWSKLFSALSNKTIGNEEEIQLCFIEYINKLFHTFSKFSRTFDMNSKTSQLVKIMRGLYSYHLYENLLISETENREFYCMDLTTQLMPDLATNIMYEMQDKDYINRRNVKIKMIFDKLQETLEKSFKTPELNNEVQNIFLKRLFELKINVITKGNTDSFLNIYDPVEIDNNKYHQTILELVYKYRSTVYSLVNKEVKASSLLHYFVSPFDSQPRSFYGSSLIVFHPPLYLSLPENLPEYISIAKVGIHLAHELVKHFDLIGKRYLDSSDSVDKYYKSLTSQTKNLFDFYLKNYFVLNKDNLTFQNISGSLLLNEMIVDNAAFRLTTDTIKENHPLENLTWLHESYTPLQTFAIIAAQEYCHMSTPENFMYKLYEQNLLPSEIKIKNMLSNYELFQNLFDCADGSNMFLPPDLIVQFPYVREEEEEYDQYLIDFN